MPDISRSGKDAKIALFGRWIIEIAELEAIRKADRESIKKFASIQRDSERLPYDKHNSDIPRRCIFAGTHNPDGEGYFADATGNRRFLPVLVGDKIDVEGIARDRDQLWAEAKVLYQQGEPWWIEADDVEAVLEQRKRLIRYPVADDIEHFIACEPYRHRDETTGEISITWTERPAPLTRVCTKLFYQSVVDDDYAKAPRPVQYAIRDTFLGMGWVAGVFKDAEQAALLGLPRHQALRGYLAPEDGYTSPGKRSVTTAKPHPYRGENRCAEAPTEGADGYRCAEVTDQSAEVTDRSVTTKMPATHGFSADGYRVTDLFGQSNGREKTGGVTDVPIPNRNFPTSSVTTVTTASAGAPASGGAALPPAVATSVEATTATAKPTAATTDVANTDVATTVAELQAFLATVDEHPNYTPESPIGLDIETTALRPKDGRIRLLQLWYGGEGKSSQGFVVDLDRLDGGVKALAPILETRSFVCFNAQFEWSWLHANGVTLDIERLHDAKLAHAALVGGSISLKEAARRYLGGEYGEVDKDLQGSDWNKSKLTDEQIAYALKDAELARRLWEVLAPRMDELDVAVGDGSQQRVADGYALLRNAVPMVCKMQLAGMRFDLACHAKEVARCKDIHEAATHDLERLVPASTISNWNSPKQIQDWLKAVLPLEVRRRWPRTSTKRLATGAEVIEEMLSKPVGEGRGELREPIPDQVRHTLETYLRRQKVATILKTFGEGLAEQVAPEHPESKGHHGRLYGDFQIAGAVTGRMTSVHPNLQNIPGGEFRDLFVASPGYRLVVADYSQIEVRVGGLLAGDERVAEQFAKGHDFHKATAALMTGKAIEDVTDAERKLAKGITFGMQYGMGDASLAKHLGVSVEEAREQIQRWEATYQGIAEWRRQSAERGKTTRELRTASGRRIQLHARPAPSVCFNYPVQGSAADVMYAALSALDERLELYPRVRPLAVVHDEIVLEAPIDEVEDVKQELERAMTEGFLEVFPDGDATALVTAHDGRTWGQAK